MKEFTRGKKIDKEKVREFVSNLDIPNEDKIKLKNLTPNNYTGLAENLTLDLNKYLNL